MGTKLRTVSLLPSRLPWSVRGEPRPRRMTAATRNDSNSVRKLEGCLKSSARGGQVQPRIPEVPLCSFVTGIWLQPRGWQPTLSFLKRRSCIPSQHEGTGIRPVSAHIFPQTACDIALAILGTHGNVRKELPVDIISPFALCGFSISFCNQESNPNVLPAKELEEKILAPWQLTGTQAKGQ